MVVTTDADEKITGIRGDKDDPFSRGHICPKGPAMRELLTDPDRARRPMRRTKGGWKPISWNEGPRRDGRSLRRDPARSRQELGRHLHGQSALAQSRGHARRAGLRRCPAYPQQVRRQLARREPQALRGPADVRIDHQPHHPRHRSHRLLPRARRQSTRVEWQPHEPGRRSRAAQGRQGTRRKDRRRRPASHRDGRRCRSASGHSTGR